MLRRLVFYWGFDTDTPTKMDFIVLIESRSSVETHVFPALFHKQRRLCISANLFWWNCTKFECDFGENVTYRVCFGGIALNFIIKSLFWWNCTEF